MLAGRDTPGVDLVSYLTGERFGLRLPPAGPARGHPLRRAARSDSRARLPTGERPAWQGAVGGRRGHAGQGPVKTLQLKGRIGSATGLTPPARRDITRATGQSAATEAGVRLRAWRPLGERPPPGMFLYGCISSTTAVRVRRPASRSPRPAPCFPPARNHSSDRQVFPGFFLDFPRRPGIVIHHIPYLVGRQKTRGQGWLSPFPPSR
jgi:hypothetical protein